MSNGLVGFLDVVVAVQRDERFLLGAGPEVIGVANTEGLELDVVDSQGDVTVGYGPGVVESQGAPVLAFGLMP